jgi:tetratricopeptide (TPR) repeat protein
VIRNILALLAVLATLGAPVARAQSFSDAKGTTDLTVVPAQEFRKLLEKARQAVETGDYEDARAEYTKALAQDVSRAEKRDALLELGRLLEEKLKLTTKAATVYEQFLSIYPQDTDCPDVNLRTGRIYRDMGSFKSALNKFYDVLYAALRVKNGEEYKGSALRAQLEIASTYFTSGEYEQAGRYYSRLKLLELPPEDRRDVAFRAAYILYLDKDYAAALAAGRQFLSQYPECVLTPEAEYLVIQSLKGLNRNEEALAETLQLLRSGEKFGREHPDVWAYWQQKTGNDLANELYNKGDYLHALTIYQTLAEISNSPAWRWPAVYQIGLCFERLRYTDRALQAYKYVIDGAAPDPKTAQDAKSLPTTGVNLTTLKEMAQWRSDHLRWLKDAGSALDSLLGPDSTPQPSKVTLNDARPEPTPQQQAKANPPAAAQAKSGPDSDPGTGL